MSAPQSFEGLSDRQIACIHAATVVHSLSNLAASGKKLTNAESETYISAMVLLNKVFREHS